MTDLIQGIYDESIGQQHRLGELYTDPFGRKYRYVQAGVVALAAGHLLQEPAENTAYRSMVVQAAAAIGDTAISVTLGGTAVTANQFETGDLLVESSTGLGQAFKIVRHTVQTSSTGTCTFTLDRALKVAITTSSQVSVRKNSYDGVIDYPTTPTGGPVGFALYAMTAAYYGWVQSGGDVQALYDTGANFAADESAMMPSRDVAGSVTPMLETVAAGIAIGWAREQVSVDSTYGFVHTIID